jgi:hypothetical protein
MIWKRQETPKELFFSSWIANANLNIRCVIPCSSFLLLKLIYKILNLRARKKTGTLNFWKTLADARSSKFNGTIGHPIPRLNLDPI